MLSLSLGARDPFPPDQPKSAFFVLLETSGSNSDHDLQVIGSSLLFHNAYLQKLEFFLEKSTESGLINYGLVAQDLSQAG